MPKMKDIIQPHKPIIPRKIIYESNHLFEAWKSAHKRWCKSYNQEKPQNNSCSKIDVKLFSKYLTNQKKKWEKDRKNINKVVIEPDVHHFMDLKPELNTVTWGDVKNHDNN